MFTLELVWPTSRVEPGSMDWCEQKNNQKKKKKPRPGSKILTLEIAGFNPGSTRARPALSVEWTEIADRDSMSCWNWPKTVLNITCLFPYNILRLLSLMFWTIFFWATTAAYYRQWHPPWWSKVTGHRHETVNFWAQYDNLPMRIEARRISPR